MREGTSEDVSSDTRLPVAVPRRQVEVNQTGQAQSTSSWRVPLVNATDGKSTTRNA